jgi:putative heme-binding domain-containing protein
MRRTGVLAALGLLLAAGWIVQTCSVEAQGKNASVQWIWFNEGNPAESAPAETRYFRKVFPINRDVQKPVDEAELDITADNQFTVWVNGHLIGKGDDWKRVYRFDVRKYLVHGKNVVAVKAHNTEGPAGLLVRLGYVPNGMSKEAMVSDGSWKAAKTAPAGWEKVDFDDSKWTNVKVIGPYGKAGPWKNLVWDAGGNDRFSVPVGFRVEQAVKTPANDSTFSLVNLCFDARGRLLVSREGGPILLCTNPDKHGVLQDVKPYCTQVTNCQGMCWVKDALLVVGDRSVEVTKKKIVLDKDKKKKEVEYKETIRITGLYRVTDTKGADHTDKVELLHAFSGGMGEHGPHAILHGPDNWLYLVIGNHAWAKIGPDAAKNGANPAHLAANSPLTRWPTGGMGPDQGQPNTTEDVLLPRLNDARGHAANIRAPGGTIWRLDHQGKNMSLVAAGFRNHFDAAFSPAAELFTFDSDMEWDENLPWYRAVRVCHCPPGADFVWRTGAANTPDYYIDSLPPLYETGRGSPVGLEFYDHQAFPEKYRGAYFMADWSLGLIYAVHLKRDGATYKGEVEKFCAGAPMNVTDIAVGPDGALYFVMGGRGSQGGVYRIVYTEPLPQREKPGFFDWPRQPLSAWGRVQTDKELQGFKGPAQRLLEDAGNEKLPLSQRLHCLTLTQALADGRCDGSVLPQLLPKLLKDRSPEIRAQVVWLLGINNGKNHQKSLLGALKDDDPLVRRRACEALIRAGIEPPVKSIWPLLADSDRFVRHAARLVLQRIDPKKWAQQIWREGNDLIAWNGIVALCHTNQAASRAEQIFERLHNEPGKDDVQSYLDYLRTIQLALVHTAARPITVKVIADGCYERFPRKDWRVNRELAILLTYFQREKQLSPKTQSVPLKLMAALRASKDDRLQQMHYFYCLRLLKDGWSVKDKRDLAAWYDGTKTWTGGHSFTPFLENIFRETLGTYTLAERKQLLQRGDKMPLPALVLAQRLKNEPDPELVPALNELSDHLAKNKKVFRAEELRQTITDALVKAALSKPSAENFPYLVRGLESPDKLLRSRVLEVLRKLPTKPKADDPAPYRALILATPTLLSAKDKQEAIALLRQWNGRSFGAPQWQDELKLWSKWFAQNFPKEPPLPDVAPDKPAQSKYQFEELLTYLEKGAGRKGDVARGRVVFEKAQCLKCHKHGKEGEGLGPDLTTVSKRFKRSDILESIIYPSKVISDQYRSTTIITKKGQSITGLAAVQGDTVTVLQSDGTKVTLQKSEIDEQLASLISVMPERLLDPLTLQEIADLFAFLESEPK